MIISLAVWHDPADEPLCEVPFDFSFEEEDSVSGMRDLILEEVRSFRYLVRQQSMPPARKDSYVVLSLLLFPHPQHFVSLLIRSFCSHELPPAPPAPQHPGAGVGPAFHERANSEGDMEEHPGSALEKQLERQKLS